MTSSLPALHQPLSSEPQQIRLLKVISLPGWDTIYCSLKTFELANAPKYRALSYEWGEADMRTIFISGYQFQVRKNLHGFLQVYQGHLNSGWIWIDQLCIDQSNVDERNSQVSIMHLIFAGAEQTFIWLGTDPNHGAAFAAVDEIYAQLEGAEDFDAHAMNLELHLPSIKSIVTKILDTIEKEPFRMLSHCSYWQRHWIAQEIILSRNPKLLYGTRTYNWSRFSQMYFTIGGSNSLFVFGSPGLTSLINLDLEFKTRHRVSDSWSITWIAIFAGESKCQDLRDKIFGIQAVLPPALRLSVDYSMSVEEVCIEAVCTYAVHLDSDELIDVGGDLMRAMKIKYSREFRNELEDFDKTRCDREPAENRQTYERLLRRNILGVK